MQCNLNIHSLRRKFCQLQPQQPQRLRLGLPLRMHQYLIFQFLQESQKSEGRTASGSHICVGIRQQQQETSTWKLKLQSSPLSVQGATLLRSNDYWTYSIRARVTLLILQTDQIRLSIKDCFIKAPFSAKFILCPKMGRG